MGNEWRRRLNCPKLFFCRAKSMAVTLKELLAEALESRLDATRSVREGKAAAPKWMRIWRTATFAARAQGNRTRDRD
jgi:hypothetical protein